MGSVSYFGDFLVSLEKKKKCNWESSSLTAGLRSVEKVA